jgi:hypothetical protein
MSENSTYIDLNFTELVVKVTSIYLKGLSHQIISDGKGVVNRPN